MQCKSIKHEGNRNEVGRKGRNCAHTVMHYPTGHCFIAHLYVASWPHETHLDRLIWRNRHLAKVHQRQEWEGINPRFNTDQNSPQRGYNSHCVVFLIWLAALFFRFCCKLMSTYANCINLEGLTCLMWNVRMGVEPTWFTGLPHSCLSFIAWFTEPLTFYSLGLIQTEVGVMLSSLLGQWELILLLDLFHSWLWESLCNI